MTQRRLRVAHVSLGLETGGQEKLLAEFARCADRDRFELVCVSLTGRGPIADAVEHHGWPVLALDAPGGWRPSLVWRLRRLFREQQIDIVHTHDERPLMYGVPAARLAGARAIHTQHHGQLPGTRRGRDWLATWAARLTHSFVAVSRDAARYYVETGLPAERVRTIWNGIDLDRFAFHGPKIAGPVVVVARLSPEKGLTTLLHAASNLHKVDPKFRLEIAGDGPCREELLGLTHELGLGPVVKFLGNVAKVPELLSRASLFVLPSKSEGISLTLLEAMATGLPIVATAVGGNPEVVVDGQTGMLVPPENPEELATAMRRMRDNGENAQLMGRAGRRRVECFFDIRSVVARYEQLYVGDSVAASEPSEVLA
jgi:glycosyltransferase involved in cell wall biosynthesis